jgi:phosphoglycerate kinase
MNSAIPLMQQLDVRGKISLLRVDFNVPVDRDGQIGDETKLRESLPTIIWLLKQGSRIRILSHLGRPVLKDPKYSLRLCVHPLAKLLQQPVGWQADLRPEFSEVADIVLMENLRFYPAEEDPKQDPQFAEQLARLGDCYINDAFAATHRPHTSIVSLPKFFPDRKGAGLLLQREIAQFNLVCRDPIRPFFMIIGGAKISSKLGILNKFLHRVDAFFIGGGMAFTFLQAMGMVVGNSLVDPDLLYTAQQFLNECQKEKIPVMLPEDCVIAERVAQGADCRYVDMQEGIPQGWYGLDIGPKTCKRWSKKLQEGKTILWNGPLGVFEIPPFADGTESIARTLSELEGVITVVGGGDSLAAIAKTNLNKKFTHLSTGGGAMLEYLEFETLVGLNALRE